MRHWPLRGTLMAQSCLPAATAGLSSKILIRSAVSQQVLRQRPGHGSRGLPLRWDGDQTNVQRVPQGRRNAVQQEQSIAVHVRLF